MSRSAIPPSLRRQISEQARHRCGYCLTAAILVGSELEIDHLIPHSRGGKTEELNLWLACAGCNDIKSNRIYGTDPLSYRSVKLYNPRLQSWDRHFEWRDGGAIIEGLTATGRATVELLRLNRPALVRSRRIWIVCGLHPPAD